jgi:hypothetical protein
VNRLVPPRVRQGVTWRVLTALAVMVSAAVHLQLWLEGMGAVDVVGPAFLLNAAGGAAIATAVLVWRSWLPLLGAVAFGLSTLAAFALSVTVGLFGVHERLLGAPQVVSAVAEVVAVAGAVAALLSERRARSAGLQRPAAAGGDAALSRRRPRRPRPAP